MYVHTLSVLRILAILAIALYHYISVAPNQGWVTHQPDPSVQSFFNFGILGLNVLFMISGFTLCQSLWFTNRDCFATRRFVKIMPLFAVCTLLTALTMAIGDVPADFKSTPIDVLGSLLMVSGFVPASWGNRDVSGVDWTVFALVQFSAYTVLLSRVRGWKHHLESLLCAWGLAIASVVVLISVGVDVPWFVQLLVMSEHGPWFLIGAATGAHTLKGNPITHYLVLGEMLQIVVQSLSQPGSAFWLMAQMIVVGLFLVTVYHGDRLSYKVGLRDLALDVSLLAAPFAYTFFLLHHHLGIMMLEALSTSGGFYMSVLITLISMMVLSFIIQQFTGRILTPATRIIFHFD